jgi:hypothetical protein
LAIAQLVKLVSRLQALALSSKPVISSLHQLLYVAYDVLHRIPSGTEVKTPTISFMHCWWECKLVQALWKSVWKFLWKIKIEPPYDPAMLLLDIYLKECKSTYHWDTCTPMFIKTLFTIAKVWNQPKCPSADEWIKKIWYIYMIECYLSIKKH